MTSIVQTLSPVTNSQAAASVAALVARYLAEQGVQRVYGLCGGHIQPLWDEVSRAGIQIVDVRHEGSAVYMAHAEAELTGRVGVALVTAGPGLTNALTAVANAEKSRIPVLVISGVPPLQQEGRLAMQDVPQRRMIEPVSRLTLSVTLPDQTLARLDSVMRAAQGHDGPPGPAYIEFPTDVLRSDAVRTHVDEDWLQPVHVPARTPDPRTIADAVALIRRARRPLVIAGRAVHSCTDVLPKFLEASGALYLDTVESRGALPEGHEASVPSLRGQAMREADLIITLDRLLDFQLAYGSPAVYGPDASFLRVGRTSGEVAFNRRGDVQMQADVASALDALTKHDLEVTSRDSTWRAAMTTSNQEKRRRAAEALRTAPAGNEDGRMHPNRLIAELNSVIDDSTLVVADGGDILSFARVGLRHGARYLDCGPLGCLGVGVPFATAGALVSTDRRVVCLVGDGSFGFTAMDLETAVRFGARILVVVANNDGWNIERMDQIDTYGGNLVGVELGPCRYDQLAQSLGAYGERVEDPASLAPAIERALAHDGPALLDVAVTREAFSPDYLSGLAVLPDHQPLARWNTAELRYRSSWSDPDHQVSV